MNCKYDHIAEPIVHSDVICSTMHAEVTKDTPRWDQQGHTGRKGMVSAGNSNTQKETKRVRKANELANKTAFEDINLCLFCSLGL